MVPILVKTGIGTVVLCVGWAFPECHVHSSNGSRACAQEMSRWVESRNTPCAEEAFAQHRGCTTGVRQHLPLSAYEHISFGSRCAGLLMQIQAYQNGLV